MSLNAPGCDIGFPRPVDWKGEHNKEERDQKDKEPENDQGP
ncbi:MAG TPA: hypothetical protein VN702_19355 [Acetobacteraceae bacterium]|nr:hypothetical protein [Acetobacteraceae bacterium]